MSFSALRIICDVWYILIKEGEVSPCVKIFISSARPPSVSVSANMCMAPRLKRVGQKTSTAAPDSCVKFYADIVKNKAIKRKLSRALIESNTYLHENPTTAEEVILDKVEQNILS